MVPSPLLSSAGEPLTHCSFAHELLSTAASLPTVRSSSVTAPGWRASPLSHASCSPPRSRRCAYLCSSPSSSAPPLAGGHGASHGNELNVVGPRRARDRRKDGYSAVTSLIWILVTSNWILVGSIWMFIGLICKSASSIWKSASEQERIGRWNE
ncbi:hypothetical protein SEVIR_7G293200v4 [Setaria viridis]|uniref:Uncharacterized protein n=1 Tax=Setaria viridis TaxID=4556 RepID=A0A4U6TVS9_SETVI|nr:hypothetical protein SEVIR_7G293200v2 [Setaria viridis]